MNSVDVEDAAAAAGVGVGVVVVVVVDIVDSADVDSSLNYMFA